MKKFNFKGSFLFKGFLIFVVFFLVAGCLETKKTSTNEEKKETTKNFDNVCELFPKEIIEEAIGRKIVKVENPGFVTEKACFYYTAYSENFLKDWQGKGLAGGPNIVLAIDPQEEFETLKKDVERVGDRLEKDSRINSDHFVCKSRASGEIWQVILFMKGNQYLRIKANYQAVNGDELVKIAQNILKKKPDLFGSRQIVDKDTLPLPKEEEIIRNFANLIDEGKADEAASMMKVNDETERKMWAEHFSMINYFKVKGIEKTNEGDWTEDRHQYKVILEVQMNPKSANAPIPYYGWKNGENTRWITLEKVEGLWKIAEIATGP